MNAESLLKGNSKVYARGRKQGLAVVVALATLYANLHWLHTGEWPSDPTVGLGFMWLYSAWRIRLLEEELNSSKGIIAEFLRGKGE